MPEEPANPDDSTIHHDVACERCGYNLRGLLRDGNCPECGGSVLRSLRRPTIDFADAGWLRRLGLGFRLILVSWLSIVFALALTFFEPTRLGYDSASLIQKSFELALPMMLWVGCGLSFAGLWLTTMQEPGGNTQFYWPLGARLARAGTLALPVYWVIARVLENHWSRYPTLEYLFPACFYLILGIMLFYYLRQLRLLATRMSNSSLKKQTNFLSWLIAAFSFSITGMLMAVLLDESSQKDYSSFIVIFACPMGLCMIVFVFWFAGLMVQFHLKFKRVNAKRRRNT